MKKIRIGSRESKLAVIQSKLVMEQIARTHPEIELELHELQKRGKLMPTADDIFH
ncbi:MAG: hydroxymethylbilane synthase, partial [Anaerovoracaceae bacterium]